MTDNFYGRAIVATTPNNFLGELDCRYLDGHDWLILASFTYHLGTPDGPEFVPIITGDITDFASSPRIVKLWYPSPGGPWDKPAVVHDKLYKDPRVWRTDGSFRILNRGQCDAAFNEAMGVTNTPEDAQRLHYRGVRVLGWWAWRRYRCADQRLAA